MSSGGPDRRSRIVTKQYASQGSCFTLFKLGSRLRNDRIQLSGLKVRLDLFIPHARIELKEPGSKLSQILGRKICYRFLKLFNLTYGFILRLATDDASL